MRIIIYLIYLFIIFGSLFTLRAAKVRATSWQNFVIIFSIAGAYLCGYFYALC